MNKRKLRVLNPAEMRPLTGGTDATYKCSKIWRYDNMWFPCRREGVY